MTPEELARAEAKKIAEFHFPRSKHAQRALENDVFIALRKGIETAFSAGLAMGLKQSGSELVVEVDGKNVVEESCVCCGDVLLPGPPPLCEKCFDSYTDYGVDGAYCDTHAPAEEPPAIVDVATKVMDAHDVTFQKLAESEVHVAVDAAALRTDVPERREPNLRREPVKRFDDARGYVPRR